MLIALVIITASVVLVSLGSVVRDVLERRRHTLELNARIAARTRHPTARRR